eukprot:2577446-Heterocapsa_arctica.AAC.1
MDILAYVMTNWPGTVIKHLKHIEMLMQGIRGTAGLSESCTKTDNPPLAIHKAMLIISGILQRELTNNEEPNKVRITQPVNDDTTQVWTGTHVPECSVDLKKEMNKAVGMKNGIGKNPKPESPLSRAPFQFLSHDGLKIDHPGNKESQEFISAIREEGNHIWVEKGSKETTFVTIRVANTRPECNLDALVELRGEIYAITWKFISHGTFIFRTTGTLEMRLLIAYFKGRD